MSEKIKFEIIKKIAENNFRYKNLKKISKFESNSPPSVFVGSGLKYPQINVGILSPLDKDEDAWIYDDAKYWAENNFKIGEVLKIRDSLLNSRFRSSVYDSKKKQKGFFQLAQDIAISSKPVDVEIELKNQLDIGRKKDKVLTPHGMQASLKQARVVSNVKINQKLDKIMHDEIKAVQGINYLYKNNFSEYTLSKILSVGVLGLKSNKKLVPTRWSITATDDTISKSLCNQIKDFKWIENNELFFGEFMGNQYIILLFPGVWSFELFELYLPKSSWNPGSQIKAATDFEGYSGRKSYALNTGGGYYATRLPILEFLFSIKRQASVLAIRLETPNYWAALGVWVVRESVRKALRNRGVSFEDFNSLIKESIELSKDRFGFEISQILQRSKLLERLKTQKTLKEWI